MQFRFFPHATPGGWRDDLGMTLTELLVAMVVGLILTAGIFNFFIIQTKHLNEGRQTAEMQQELRWAATFMADRLKLAGNGVPPTSGFRVLTNYNNVTAGSDSIVVVASYKSLVVSTTQNMGNEGSQIKVSSSEGVEDYDLIVISYPPYGWQEMFLCTKVASDLHIYHDAYPPWNDDNKLDHKYPAGSIVSVVSQFSFFIQVDNNGHPNLMVQTQGPVGPQILAGDIDSFQIVFKLKDGSRVTNPVNVSDIRMMEIVLRARTPNPIQGYQDPEYGDAYKRIELKTVVIPKNVTLVGQ